MFLSHVDLIDKLLNYNIYKISNKPEFWVIPYPYTYTSIYKHHPHNHLLHLNIQTPIANHNLIRHPSYNHITRSVRISPERSPYSAVVPMWLFRTRLPVRQCVYVRALLDGRPWWPWVVGGWSSDWDLHVARGYLNGIVQFLLGLFPAGSSNRFHRKISYLFRRGCRWRQCIDSVSLKWSPHSEPAASVRKRNDDCPAHCKIRKQRLGNVLFLTVRGRQRSPEEVLDPIWGRTYF